MTGIAALAMCGMFTSCSHDMSLYSGSQSEQVLQKYEDTFVETFGEPAPTQTWGFGSTSAAATRGMTRSVGTYADYKGSLEPNATYYNNMGQQVQFTFPSDCDASNFTPDLDGVKSYKEIADAANQGGGFATGICYIDENHTGKVHIWGGNERAKLYFKAGTYDFTNETFDLCQNADLFLLNGATLTLNNAAASTVKFNIYIASGAKLIANGTDGLRLDNGAKVYNHGEIETSKCEVNNTSLLYNVGTLTSSGKTWVANKQSVIVNDGSITIGSENAPTEFESAGGGNVQNNAEITIYGNTFVSSNSAIWVNNGHWTTTYYTYIAGSFNVINNCYLEVTEDFRMNLGDGQGSFRMDSGAGVLTKNLCAGGPWDGKDQNGNESSYTGGPFRIDMGSNSVFKVTGTAHLNATKQNGYGFHGNGDGYAVFQAKNVVKETTGEANVTYAGKLYVSAETHFAQGYSGQYPYIKLEDGCSEANIYAAGDDNFSTGNPDITIPATPCNPGFGGGGGVQPVTESIRVIGEDLTVNQRSDFDFNDIVFDVFWTHTPESAEKQIVKVKILAAGGELPIYIGNGDNALEIHELFGAENPTRNITVKTMMNTTNGNHYYENPDGSINSNAYKCPVVLLEDDWWHGDNIQDIANSIQIRVYKPSTGSEFVLKAPKGDVPSKIAVGTDYEWCDERQDIDKKYPTDNVEFDGRFSEYVAGQHDWNTWYLQKK